MTTVNADGYDCADPTTAPTATPGITPGSLTVSSVYGYKITYVTPFGESAPSSAGSNTTTSSGSMNLTNLALSPQTNVQSRRIYRTTAGGSVYSLLATLLDNFTTTYADILPDGALGAAAPTFSQAPSRQQLSGYTKMTNPEAYSFEIGITAGAGGTQVAAYQLSKEMNFVTVVTTANDSVKLPAATANLTGLRVVIRNNGANTLRTYPFSGQTLNGGAADSSATQAAATTVQWIATTASNWASF